VHGTKGFYVGPVLTSVRSFRCWILRTQRVRHSSSVAWFPTNFLMPGSSPLELVLAAVTDLTAAITTLASSTSPTQRGPILELATTVTTALRDIAQLYHPHNGAAIAARGVPPLLAPSSHSASSPLQPSSSPPHPASVNMDQPTQQRVVGPVQQRVVPPVEARAPRLDDSPPALPVPSAPHAPSVIPPSIPPTAASSPISSLATIADPVPSTPTADTSHYVRRSTRCIPISTNVAITSRRRPARAPKPTHLARLQAAIEGPTVQIFQGERQRHHQRATSR